MGGILRTVNRVLLGLIGLIALALGLAVLAGGFDVYRRWDLRPPADWPWTRPGAVLLTDADRTRWRGEGWWWPVVFAVLAVLVILLAWWLLAQLHRRRLGEVLIDTGDGEEALLRGRALEDALAAEAAAQDGIERARVALTGSRAEPRARVGLLLSPYAQPGPAVHRLTDEALEHARASASLDALPAEVRLRAARHRAERVL